MSQKWAAWPTEVTDKHELRDLTKVMLKGALTSSSATEVWTLGRVRTVLDEPFGVKLSGLHWIK